MSGTAVGVTRLPRIEVWARVIALVGTVVAAVTAFGALWINDEVSDYWLLVHLVAGGVFIFGLTASALLWARRWRTGNGLSSVARGLTFWLVLACGLVVMLSMLAAMVPVFGTAGQEELTQWHWWAAIGVLVLILIYAALEMSARRSKGTVP